MIEVCLSNGKLLELGEALSCFADGKTLAPFHSATLGLIEALSEKLLRAPEMRAHPELNALGFALRRSEMERLQREFFELQGSNRVLQPRGFIFQIAAGNVDTLFIYAWLFAVVTGNRSVVRLSSRSSPQIDLLLSCLSKLLADAPELSSSNHFIRYSHNDEITAALSGICDLRTIWGGDQSIQAIRKTSLPPFARDLLFPDRYSMAAIESTCYLASDAVTRSRLAQRFFGDAFWFDQAACSSPRLVVFCGPKTENGQAANLFFDALDQELARRGYQSDPSLHMGRFLFSCQKAIDQPITNCRPCTQMTVLSLASLEGFSREHCGGGLFFEAGLSSLLELAPHVTRRDQTLVHWGFHSNEVQGLVSALNGRGLDRIVPIGQALSFGRFWDGFDLLAEFTRSVAFS